MWFSDVRLGFELVADQLLLKKSREKEMKLLEVRRGMLEEKRRPARLRPTAPELMADLVQESEALGLSPDEAVMEPPVVSEERLEQPAAAMVDPVVAPERRQWEPRQEILSIEERIAADEESILPRRKIPLVERVSAAPDIVVAIDREAMSREPVTAGAAFGPRTRQGTRPIKEPEVSPVIAQTDEATTGAEAGTERSKSKVAVPDSAAKNGSNLFAEDVTAVSRFKPIERVLTAKVSTYETLRDFRYGYFKIEIHRVGPEVLPVAPKDIVYVQDSSASMAEQRLYFCRKGLTECLPTIGPEDRFNVVGFRAETEACFADWATNNRENRKKAKQFISQLTSEGSTDIFSAVREVLSWKRTPGRPVIVLLVTDGRSTTGLTRSSDIIGEFSKLNDGAVSVFALGTVQTANWYLLDLMSFCNRGDSVIVQSGRWSIPESVKDLAVEISRPVLAGVGFRFASGSQCEVYPVQASNLYLDRPLSLYGRYPRSLNAVVFQAVGKAGDVDCDMVFNLSVGEGTRTKDKTIRENWALQKIYHLVGQYARQPEAAILKEMRRTSRSHGIAIPYEGRF